MSRIASAATLIAAFALDISPAAAVMPPPVETPPPLIAVRQIRDQIRIMIDRREVAIHHSGGALDKSYIHPLWTPDRRCITYDAPADHVHHRGLCVGWPDVAGLDFWAEVNSPPGRRGRMIPRKIATATAPDRTASIRETNDWMRRDGTAAVKEEREWRFLPPRGNLQIVDLDIRLTAVQPEVVFGSDPKKPREYHGLTLRMGPFDQPRFFNSEGDEGWEACHGKAARWCALSGLQSGRPVTAAIFGPQPKEGDTARFFVLGRGMQFISSSPNFTKPKVLKQGQTWRLTYAILAAGAPPKDQPWNLNQLWSSWSTRLPPASKP